MTTPRIKRERPMVMLNVHVPHYMRDEIEEMVKTGRYVTMAEAVRTALREFLQMRCEHCR